MKRFALVLAALSTLLFVACRSGTTGGPAPVEGASPNEELSSAPTPTPYTARPDIKNRWLVARAIESEYPIGLRSQRIGGTVTVWFFIDEGGKATRTLVSRSSGYDALDNAALRVGAVIEFTPALNEGRRVPVWISLPITFVPGGI